MAAHPVTRCSKCKERPASVMLRGHGQCYVCMEESLGRLASGGARMLGKNSLGGHRVLLCASGGSGSRYLLDVISKWHDGRARQFLRMHEGGEGIPKTAFACRRVSPLDVASEFVERMRRKPFRVDVLLVNCLDALRLCDERVVRRELLEADLDRFCEEVRGTGFRVHVLRLYFAWLEAEELEEVVLGSGVVGEEVMTRCREKMERCFGRCRTRDAMEMFRRQLVRFLVRRVSVLLRSTIVLEGTTSDKAAAQLVTDLGSGDAAAAEDARPTGVLALANGEEIPVVRIMLSALAAETTLACRFRGFYCVEQPTYFTGRPSARGGLTAVGNAMIQRLRRHRPDGSGIVAIIAAIRKLAPEPPHDEEAIRCLLCTKWTTAADVLLARRAGPSLGVAPLFCYGCRHLLAETDVADSHTLAALGHGADAAVLRRHPPQVDPDAPRPDPEQIRQALLRDFTTLPLPTDIQHQARRESASLYNLHDEIKEFLL